MDFLPKLSGGLSRMFAFLKNNPVSAYALSVIKRPAFWKLVLLGVVGYFAVLVVIWILQVLITIAGIAFGLWILCALMGGKSRSR